MLKDCPEQKVIRAPTLDGAATIVDFAGIELDYIVMQEAASFRTGIIGFSAIEFSHGPETKQILKDKIIVSYFKSVLDVAVLLPTDKLDNLVFPVYSSNHFELSSNSPLLFLIMNNHLLKTYQVMRCLLISEGFDLVHWLFK